MRSLADRLRLLLEAVPPGGAVTLPRAAVAEWLEEDGQELPHDAQRPIADLTAEEIAQQFDRTPACVRGWCRAGRMPGAYRLNGREWRIPRATLAAYLEAERSGANRTSPSSNPPTLPSGAVDLGAWRREEAS